MDRSNGLQRYVQKNEVSLQSVALTIIHSQFDNSVVDLTEKTGNDLEADKYLSAYETILVSLLSKLRLNKIIANVKIS